jgi:hypothetical protein
MDWFKETNDFDLEYSSNIQDETKYIFSFLIPMVSPKANINFGGGH